MRTGIRGRNSAILEVMKHRESAIAKDGQLALATVGPVRAAPWKSPEGSWIGKVTIAADIVETGTSELWDVLRERDQRMIDSELEPAVE